MGLKQFNEHDSSSMREEPVNPELQVPDTYRRWVIRNSTDPVCMGGADRTISWRKTFSRDIKEYQTYLIRGSFDKRYFELFKRRLQALKHTTRMQFNFVPAFTPGFDGKIPSFLPIQWLSEDNNSPEQEDSIYGRAILEYMANLARFPHQLAAFQAARERQALQRTYALEERGWGDARDYNDGIPASLVYFSTPPGPIVENDWGLGGIQLRPKEEKTSSTHEDPRIVYINMW